MDDGALLRSRLLGGPEERQWQQRHRLISAYRLFRQVLRGASAL